MWRRGKTGAAEEAEGSVYQEEMLRGMREK